MSKISTFEDLDCWKIGKELSELIYIITRKREFARDHGLLDQIRRAVVSIMTNIAEGFERGSNKVFAEQRPMTGILTIIFTLFDGLLTVFFTVFHRKELSWR